MCIATKEYILEYAPQDNKKSYGNKLTSSMEKELSAVYSKVFNPNQDPNQDQIEKAELKDLKNTMYNSLSSLLQKYINGEISANQFKNSARKEFKVAYEQAFMTGSKASGLNLKLVSMPKEDKKWLTKIRKEEYKYLENFLSDVTNGKGKMDYFDRLRMYIDFVDSIYDAGKVEAMPTNGTTIHWILDEACDNCPDCVGYAANSPYNPETLPTTPGAGSSRCLSNCKCTLKIEYAQPENLQIDRTKFNNKKPYLESLDYCNRADEMLSNLYEYNYKKSFVGETQRVLLLEHKINMDRQFFTQNIVDFSCFDLFAMSKRAQQLRKEIV